MEKTDWLEEAREEFKRKTEEVEIGRGTIDEEVEKLKKRIKMEGRVRRVKKRAEGKEGW